MSILNQFIKETEAMATAEAISNVVPFLKGKADRIRRLIESGAKNVIDIGQELLEAQEAFPLQIGAKGRISRPGWAEWIRDEFDFTDNTASKYIKVFNKFGGVIGNRHVAATATVLFFLSADNVPEEGRDEVIRRATDGEKIGLPLAKEIVAKHAPTPSEARKIARETKKPTLASDGNIYFGATKEEEKRIERRREIIFDVRRAVDTLSAMEMTPTEFLKFGLTHQYWNKQEEHKIGEAAAWLSALAAAWEKR